MLTRNNPYPSNCLPLTGRFNNSGNVKKLL